jgi:Cu/Ag efflux pump CusA
MVGAAVGAELVGGFESIEAVAGAVAVVAFAVRHSILMVDHYQRLEREPGAEFGLDLILRGTEDRLGPVVTTVVVAALFIAPFIAIGAVPGLEIIRPMFIVILCGLSTSALYTLYVVPAVIFGTGPHVEPELETQSVDQPTLSPA